MSRHHAKLPSRRWERLRKRILERDAWTCRECGRYANEVDHVRALRKGGAAWDESNLQVLCGGREGCHAQKTRRENRRELTVAEAEWEAFAAELGRTT